MQCKPTASGGLADENAKHLSRENKEAMELAKMAEHVSMNSTALFGVTNLPLKFVKVLLDHLV